MSFSEDLRFVPLCGEYLPCQATPKAPRSAVSLWVREVLLYSEGTILHTLHIQRTGVCACQNGFYTTVLPYHFCLLSLSLSLSLTDKKMAIATLNIKCFQKLSLFPEPWLKGD